MSLTPVPDQDAAIVMKLKQAEGGMLENGEIDGEGDEDEDGTNMNLNNIDPEP